MIQWPIFHGEKCTRLFMAGFSSCLMVRSTIFHGYFHIVESCWIPLWWWKISNFQARFLKLSLARYMLLNQSQQKCWWHFDGLQEITWWIWWSNHLKSIQIHENQIFEAHRNHCLALEIHPSSASGLAEFHVFLLCLIGGPWSLREGKGREGFTSWMDLICFKMLKKKAKELGWTGMNWDELGKFIKHGINIREYLRRESSPGKQGV